MSIDPTPRVVVSLGTDHHRFDRLVIWVDEWLARQSDPPSCLVQHGASPAPRVADGVDLLSREDMLALYSSADVAVVQGGPGSIFDARSAGLVPVAVPRIARLHEVVDDHQVAFCRQLAREGEVVVAQTREAFFEALDSALAGGAPSPRVGRISPAPHAAEALRDVIRSVSSHRAGLFSVRRVLRSFNRP